MLPEGRGLVRRLGFARATVGYILQSAYISRSQTGLASTDHIIRNPVAKGKHNHGVDRKHPGCTGCIRTEGFENMRYEGVHGREIELANRHTV